MTTTTTTTTTTTVHTTTGRYSQNPSAAVFTFFQDADDQDGAFHVVDNRPVKTSKFQQRRAQQQRFQQQRREREQRDGERRKPTERQQQQQQRRFDRRDQQRQVQYSSSVDIRPEWAVKEQIPLPALSRLSCAVGAPEELGAYGAVAFYDKAYDRITARTEKPLERTQRVFRSVTASDDPVLRRLASEGAGRVFATDGVLSALMCARSSVYGWDVVFTRQGDRLFIDKRDGGPLDLLTVGETAPEQIPEDRDNVNGLQQLALEATAVNQSLSQQLTASAGAKHELGEASPFAEGTAEGEELAPAGYRYRKWALGPGGPEIVVRCEANAAITTPRGEVQLAVVRALNEWNPKETDWRKRLDQSRASMLLTEAKNNKNRMARWTAEAILVGAEAIKWGYVSRAGPRDNANHSVLSVQTSKPKDFAGQIQLSMDHCWGTVRALVDAVLAMDEGKYLLVKDPNKDLLRLYAVPSDAFEANYADE